MIEAIQRITNAFVSGELDPFWTHVALLGGSVAAEFAVAAGIILESPREKGAREWLGMVLVLGGVVISAVFTISLFVFDEGISREQQAKLTNAERALVAEIERNTLRGLTKEQYDAIQSLKGKVEAVRILWSPVLDSFLFASDIALAFLEADIQVYSPNGSIPLTLKMAAAPPDLWNIGTSVYEPPTQPNRSLLATTLDRAGIAGGGGMMPNFARDWTPALPVIVVGARSMLPTHPSYFRGGTWDAGGKFHPFGN